MRIAAVLLAAGRSERMGVQKALIDWLGRPLLQYQLEQLKALDDICEVIVVTGYAPETLRSMIAGKALEAHNAAFDEGKAGSVRTGMEAVGEGYDAVLLLAVDQPRPASLLKLLVDAHAEARPLATLPTFEGRRGHPLIFDAALLPELRAVDDATLGVRAVLERHARDVREVAVDDPIVRLDINTPEDVERGQGMLADRT